MGEHERLQKIISQWGFASRRQAEQMIVAGRVRVNGCIAELGQKADPAKDRIEVDGSFICPVNRPKLIYLLMHKPYGVLSTCHDPHHRSTVIDLLPTQFRDNGIHPVGRLDLASTGALLLTNNGELTFLLTHPRHSIPKTYHVLLRGHPSESILQQWRDGVMLADKQTLPADVEILHHQRENGHTLLKVTLREGRNRQVRRVAKKLGYPVIRLHRVSIGSICLDSLPSGRYRHLTNAEVSFFWDQTRQLRSSLSV